MNYFDLLDDDTGVVNGNTLSDLKDYIEASTIDYEDDNIIHYTYCPASMLKELFNLSDDEIFELVLPLGYHICQLFGDCEYESEDYYIVKDEESVNKLISDCENYLDFTPSYEIIPNVAYDECLKEAKNKEKPTKNQLKDWAKKHKKSDKKNAWGWWVFPNVEGSINFFNRAMGSTSANGADSGAETSGNLTGTSSVGSTSAGVGESLTESATLKKHPDIKVVTSDLELKNLLEKVQSPVRVLYDEKNHDYFVCNVYDYTNFQMAYLAAEEGYILDDDDDDDYGDVYDDDDCYDSYDKRYNNYFERVVDEFIMRNCMSLIFYPFDDKGDVIAPTEDKIDDIDIYITRGIYKYEAVSDFGVIIGRLGYLQDCEFVNKYFSNIERVELDESLIVHSNYSSYVEVQKEYERILKKIRSRLKSENADKLLSEINVETTTNPPQGPAFILPNGKFIDVVETADIEDAIHFEAIWEILVRLLQLETDDENIDFDTDDITDVVNFVTDKLGWIRYNAGEERLDDRYYCIIPSKNSRKRLTQAQYKSLLKFLDLASERAKGNKVLVYAGSAVTDDKESFDSDNPDGILEKIKDYYRTGLLIESTKFTNRAIQRMNDAIEKYKNLDNLKLMNNQDNPICYESAVNNVFYFNKLGKDCTLHLGTFDETGTQIVHAWVECDEEVYQTREPKDKPKNYKLVSLKEIKIPKEFTKDEIEKAIKSSYQTLDEALNESKEDIEKFINKFGEDTYKWFLKSKDRLKNNEISTDILYHVKNTSVEDMQNILHNLQSKVKSDDLTKIQGKYKYLGEKDGYKVYQPLDALASMNLGVGSGWCTTGRYCHYGDANFKPSLKDAEKHWNDYTGQGVKFYYLLDAKTMLAKYAIAVYPETLYVKQFIENYYIEETNFEIYNAEDNIDYTAYFELKNVLELIPEKLILKVEELKDVTAEVMNGVVVPSKKYEFSKNITIPEGATSIGKYAFSDCTGLKEIIIPEGVKSIGYHAFSSCTNLTKITIPDSIVGISANAFFYCKSLENIKIPEGIESIGYNAFYGCYSLTDITIPNSIKRIDDSTFSHCISLKEITIPDGVTSIGDFAFADCSALKEIIIPGSVVEMGTFVFHDCKNLTIYCEAEEQPKYWNINWNIARCPIVWNYKNKKTESLNEKIESHETLNPKFWQEEELKQEVEDKIETITDRFVEYLNNRDIKIDIKDILLLGSNASYNYTDDSDLDIHVIVEPKEITEDEELLKQLYDLAASAFNDKFNIQLKGADAEVYVELNDTNANSNGIYSINKGWLKKPKKENVAGIELDEVEFEKWEDRYNDLLLSRDKNEMKQFIDDLYKLRKDSILKDGEYGQGNLIFKEMRNLNYIKNIKNLLDMIESQEMSLESVNK